MKALKSVKEVRIGNIKSVKVLKIEHYLKEEIKYYNDGSSLERGISGVIFHVDITNIPKREKRNGSITPTVVVSVHRKLCRTEVG